MTPDNQQPSPQQKNNSQDAQDSTGSQANPQTKNKNNLLQNKRIKTIGTVILVIGIIVGIYFYFYSLHHESTDDAFIDASISQVSPKVSGHILKVYVKDNQWVNKGDLLVKLDPTDYEIALNQASAGLAVVQSQKEGAKINVSLTDVTQNALVEQAQADLNQAKSNIQTIQSQVNQAQSKLEESKAQVTTALANYEAAESQVQSAEAQANQAEADAKRADELLKDGVITQQDKEHAITSAKTSKADVESAKKKALAAENQVIQAKASQKAAEDYLKQSQSQLEESKALAIKATGHLKEINVTPQKMAVSQSQYQMNIGELAYLKAGLDKAELQLSYTKVIAPISGKITRKSADVGDYVQIGQPLMAIVPKEVWVTANFKETQLTKMRPGQSVKIKVDAYPGKVFKGHIDSIQSGTGEKFSLLPPENATGNYVKVVQRVPVKIIFDEPIDSKYNLAPGMSCVPEVHLK